MEKKEKEGKKGLYAFFAVLGATALVVLPSAGWVGISVAWVATWILIYVLLVLWFEVKKP